MPSKLNSMFDLKKQHLYRSISHLAAERVEEYPSWMRGEYLDERNVQTKGQAELYMIIFSKMKS